ncbi:hypothetical protein BDR06DRAFT_1010436 [Suillus hirtellus]|nr:hypothetical protein BDR06DRAFT_1010436 [Suillus hirtellus]
MSVQDGALAYHDNAHPPPNYAIFMISSPDHPFFPGAPITKRMFKDLHQVVFSIVILCAWTLVPAILKAKVGHHIKMVALKNTISGWCAVILEALQNPKPNTFVINDVTPAEYAVTLAFISEEPDCGIRAKFNYFQDTQELQIMAPLPIHEQPTTHLFKAITKYTDAIPYDKRLIDVTLHLNHCMQNKDFTNIPDLQLLVAVHPPENDEDDDEAEIEILRPIIKWVGECGLSSDDNSMIRKLRLMTDSSGETDPASKVLRASPTMDYEDFIPCRIKRSLRFGPVIIQSHIWIDMYEVRYTMFKCGADGHFNFNSKNAETFAERTIYPEIKMGDIEHVLSEAAESLKEYIISLIEGMGLEEPAIWSAHESHPVWDPIWEAALNQISTTVYLTAYCRYVDWHHHKYDKCKLPVTQATTGTSLSSNPTTSSSTDQPHTPSTGLSIDVEPECSVKRVKVDNGKISKAKAKKSKKAKERVDDL